MAVTLTLVGKTPGQSQFGLDQFTEHHKTDTTADVVLTDPSVPQKGDAHPDYPFMFLTDRRVQETSVSSSALDLVYQGILNSLGGSPILPAQQNEFDTQVLSASSIKANTGFVLSTPITIQYYAPSSQKTWISYGSPDTSTSADTPIGPPIIITFTLNDNSFTGGSNDVPQMVAAFFTLTAVTNFGSKEVVAGKYWSNTQKIVDTYFPYTINIPPGFYPWLRNGGLGYTAGDILTVTTGTLEVTSVWTNGQILGSITHSGSWSMTATDIPATGGSGSGALYDIIQLM
jgi:hypothetical protein